MLDDTIAAIASPPGGAARGVVRLSGPELRRCLEGCFRPDPHVHLPSVAAPTAVSGLLGLPGVAAPLPCDLYLWPGKRSYTGQPVAEIHTLGSPPLLQLVLRTVCAAGARPAEPGEFTLRAFLAGRIDLTQAEAVLGVIDAAGDAELQVALAQLAGGLARPLHRLRDDLIDLLAHLEAGFDFADEDLPFITPQELTQRLDEAARAVADLAGQMASRGDTAELVRVVLAGRPNTGKSSLFNALARQAGALVSDEPGTTRDYLTAELDLAGVKCQLVDTAGVELIGPPLPPVGPACRAGPESAMAGRPHLGPARQAGPTWVGEGSPTIEHAAQAVAAIQHRHAHVQIVCIDSTQPLDAWECTQLAQPADGSRIVVLTKTDLPRREAMRVQGSRLGVQAVPVLFVSSVTGAGLDGLREQLRRGVLAASGPQGEAVAGTAVRCRESLRLADECLQRARGIVQRQGGEELVAAEVRVALDELGKIVGAVYTEDLLDRIFSRFCVGK